MNKIVIITIITVIMTFQIAYSQNLSDYKWKNRILILSDIDINSTNSNSVYKLLDKEIEAWKEREVIFLFLNNGKLVSTDSEKIKYDIELPKRFDGYLLIGKDGGIKMKENYPLVSQKVFDRIDSMPMRRAEMKDNNQ